MSLNFEWYKYFYYVAETTSVSRASEMLGVTQSAVSQSIKQLECLLNKKLFLRNNRGMKLTADGEVLFFYIKNGVRYFNDAEVKLKEIENSNLNKSLNVATTPVLGKHFLFDRLKLISKAGINRVEIKEFVNFNSRINSVIDGFSDFAIIKDTKNYQNDRLKILKIGELNYVFFYNPKFFDIGKIEFDSLSKYPLILKEASTETGNSFIQQFGQVLSAKFITQHDESTIELVRKGLGIGFAPKEYLTDEFKIVEINNFKSFKFDIKLIYSNLSNDIVKIFK